MVSVMTNALISKKVSANFCSVFMSKSMLLSQAHVAVGLSYTRINVMSHFHPRRWSGADFLIHHVNSKNPIYLLYL